MITIQKPKPYDWAKEDWEFIDHLIDSMTQPIIEPFTERTLSRNTKCAGLLYIPEELPPKPFG